MKLSRRNAVTVSLLAVLAFQAGCVVIGGQPTFKGSQSAKAGHVSGTPVRIETENGSIDISTVAADAGGTAEGVSISAELRAQSQERLDQVQVRAERARDGALHVWVEWPGGRRLENEGASLTLRLPDVKGVKAYTSNGGINLTELGGDADLETSNGGIRVIGQKGAVAARSSNAAITVERAMGAADLKTSNGKISVGMATAGVTARSSNGSIDISMAPGASAPVDLATSNGAVHLVVGQGFGGEIGIATSNGGIKYPGSVKVVSQSRDRARIRVGDGGGGDSLIQTSNGGVTVEVR